METARSALHDRSAAGSLDRVRHSACRLGIGRALRRRARCIARLQGFDAGIAALAAKSALRPYL